MPVGTARYLRQQGCLGEIGGVGPRRNRHTIVKGTLLPPYDCDYLWTLEEEDCELCQQKLWEKGKGAQHGPEKWPWVLREGKWVRKKPKLSWFKGVGYGLGTDHLCMGDTSGRPWAVQNLPGEGGSREDRGVPWLSSQTGRSFTGFKERSCVSKMLLRWLGVGRRLGWYWGLGAALRIG